ncbi:uncharacterized protein Triagg1_8593 [Trichoderma aggressivum f. europaeum]|uniref:DUF6546 domain-containing protein n=1 Tax=Trichoderma aggressivum f. europaeum TaxID=173218 RepID=A0AAE1LX07_9HYPO|nr:hypothetical protein Triagg1_8593 [Trichoderma aggressivum f. europaeum]
MMHRNQALVRYIWLSLELETYNCDDCGIDKIWEVSDGDCLLVTTTFMALFTILSAWKPSGGLVLDISVFSPSDARHWFKYLTFMPDTASGASPDECRPRRSPDHFLLPRCEIFGEETFDNDEQEEQWWQQLPAVPAVTAVLLRQQTRRRWKPTTLKYMFSRLPGLEGIHYEPWIEPFDHQQGVTDGYSVSLLESLASQPLRKLVLFENFNPLYLPDFGDYSPARVSTLQVSRAVAKASLELEHLSASFMVDAGHFFQACEPSWTWPNLTWLAMTSSLLGPDASPVATDDMLIAASAAAIKMPKLQVMEIWNGQEGLAVLFRYQRAKERRLATILRKGTREVALGFAVVTAWEDVAREHGCPGCKIVTELVDFGLVRSHGDAIHQLQLSNPVIRPVSLWQMRWEHKILAGAS